MAIKIQLSCVCMTLHGNSSNEYAGLCSEFGNFVITFIRMRSSSLLISTKILLYRIENLSNPDV